MRKIFQIGAALAAIVLVLPTLASAETITGAAPDTAPAAEAPTAQAPAASAPAAPVAAPPAPAVSQPVADAPAATPLSHRRKPVSRKMTRRQEIDRSIDSGTVPARYRSSVPREYQQYIPFDKR